MSSGGPAAFNFDKMISGLDSYVKSVKGYLSQLESATGGTVNLATMFNMQFHMQVLSQYLEAVSATLTAVNNEMVNMAKAVKGT
ncbi:MAG: hypothetical protein K940chlam9_00094 [Chlamydiae bacterium]|nr:hypothetical protein [Chlamydiota bacterium]